MKRSRIKPKRAGKPRPGRATATELAELRKQVHAEQNGRCDGCGKSVPLNGDTFTRMHLAHRRNKRMYGDGRSNVRGLCPDCHLIGEHNPKSVPSKSIPALTEEELNGLPF